MSPVADPTHLEYVGTAAPNGLTENWEEAEDLHSHNNRADWKIKGVAQFYRGQECTQCKEDPRNRYGKIKPKNRTQQF